MNFLDPHCAIVDLAAMRDGALRCPFARMPEKRREGRASIPGAQTYLRVPTVCQAWDHVVARSAAGQWTC